MVNFGIHLKSKIGNATYGFLSDVFTLPSVRTLNDYSTLDGNCRDGILHETLADMEHSFNIMLEDRKKDGATEEELMWARKGNFKI